MLKALKLVQQTIMAARVWGQQTPWTAAIARVHHGSWTAICGRLQCRGGCTLDKFQPPEAQCLL